MWPVRWCFLPMGPLWLQGRGMARSWDGTILLWDVSSREEIATLEGHTAGVSSVVFLPDGATLASGSDDGTILLWDFRYFLPRPHKLVKISGDKQEGLLGAELARPYVVLVRDQFGVLFQGAQVTFAVTAGGGTLSVENTVTGWSGRASSVLTLGRDPGTSTVEVTVAGIEQSETFVGKAVPTPDFDGDGTVGIADFVQFVVRFGLSQGDARYDARFDLDEDGTIGFGDFVIFANAFGKGTSSS